MAEIDRPCAGQLNGVLSFARPVLSTTPRRRGAYCPPAGWLPDKRGLSGGVVVYGIYYLHGELLIREFDTTHRKKKNYS